MEIIKNSRLGESYFRIKHKSGLTIILYPMKGYSSVYATFGTKYGSVDTEFKTNKDKDFITVPAGIAHFLEHKLFENEDCDVFELYAKTGASGNAYTSFDKTCYLFSCTDKFKESLKILLDFVQAPYFTEQTVAKEQGIIGQEIRMYDDNPGWRVFFNLLNALYVNHPVKIDIAGTVDSISEITAELLYDCYNTFYNLNNMVLSVAGNFEIDDVLSVADECLKQNENITIERSTYDEPDTIAQPEITQELSVAFPLFSIGFKAKPLYGRELLKATYETKLAMDLIAGDTSPLYREMYESGLINETFSNEVFFGNGYFAPIFEGESKKPKEVCEKLKSEIEKLKNGEIDLKRFNAVKKSNYGELVASFNSVSSVAEAALSAEFTDVNLYDGIEILAAVTPEDVRNRIKAVFRSENSALSIIKPAKA